MNSTGALAIFVKNPEISPVKTRLAATIGAENAKQFYELSLVATSSVARELKAGFSNLKIYWAVAEEESLNAKRWDSFQTISQGSGDLGARLTSVYQQLLRTHDFVCLIGADSPHISLETLKSAILSTAEKRVKNFVLGKTIDGGFYFFGGATQIPFSVWRNVEYSSDQTASQLIANLSHFGPIKFLEENFDIDTNEDLKRYFEMSNKSDRLLPEQKDLIRWAAALMEGI